MATMLSKSARKILAATSRGKWQMYLIFSIIFIAKAFFIWAAYLMVDVIISGQTDDKSIITTAM